MMDLSTEPGTAQVIILNALVDVIEGTDDVIADAESRRVIEEAFAEAIDDPDAEEFRRVIRSLTDLSLAEYRERDEIVDRVLDRVGAHLTRQSIRIEFVHESSVEFTERQVALYSFLVSPSTDVIPELGLPTNVEPVVRRGIDAVVNRDFERAADRFESVLDREMTDEAVATVEVLAGWSRFWAGDDETATDLATRALERVGDRWHVKSLWIAATHTYANHFRDSRLVIRMILNWLLDIPEGSSIEIDLSLGSEEDPTWESVDPDSEFHVFDEIATRIGYRFRLTGSIDRFPQIPGYYFGVATLYPEWHEIREIERTVHSGPETADPVERVAFRRE